MSEYFYHQQRWFTTIELSTHHFLPGQSFINFGGNQTVASNVDKKWYYRLDITSWYSWKLW